MRDEGGSCHGVELEVVRLLEMSPRNTVTRSTASTSRDVRRRTLENLSTGTVVISNRHGYEPMGFDHSSGGAIRPSWRRRWVPGSDDWKASVSVAAASGRSGVTERLSYEGYVGRDARLVLPELIAKARGEQRVFDAHADFGSSQMKSQRDEQQRQPCDQEPCSQEEGDHRGVNRMTDEAVRA